MTKKWLTRLAVTAAASTALLAGVASPAYAANTNIDLVYQDMLVGEMMHVDDGDHFRVYDWRKDGHGVEGTLQWRNPLTGYWMDDESKYNNTGSGTYVSFERDVLSIYLYRMKVCLQDGANDSTPIKCGYKEFTE